MSNADRKPTKKATKSLFILIVSAIIIIFVCLKFDYRDGLWGSCVLLVSVIILMIFMQYKPVGWKGLTEARKP